MDHIGSMLTSWLMSDGTKYLGGLNIAMSFDQATKATDFLEDKERWKYWFKWMVPGDKNEIRYGRTAWLKILGLPLKLWDKSNFSAMGRVINPFDGIRDRRDYLMSKVGVLMSKMMWINEEITIIAGGETITVGVVEYTDDLSPFKPLPFNKVEDESVDEDDKDEAIS